jgi:predicted ester cyclase
MKKLFMILPLVLIVCFMVGCQDKEAMAELEEFKAQAALEEANRALVMRYNEAWESGSLEAVKEMFSPDFVWHTTEGRDLSLEELIETGTNNYEMYKAAFPDMTFINEDVIVKGDKAITRYTFRGTHTGDLEGSPATGNELEMSGIHVPVGLRALASINRPWSFMPSFNLRL